jgi:hypothetical protein
MRFLIIAAVLVSAPGLASSAFAETAQAPPPSPATTHQDVTVEHPDWFTEEQIPYKPCPASVVFLNGLHACLGLPRYPASRGRLTWRHRHYRVG